MRRPRCWARSWSLAGASASRPPRTRRRRRMSTTRLQEVQICFGFGKQADIATANLVAAMWRLKKLNAQLATPKLNTENDAAEVRQGQGFANQTFKTSWDTGGTLEKYLSAELAAWAMCFGL